MFKLIQELKYLGLKDMKKLTLVCLRIAFLKELLINIFFYLGSRYYERIKEGLRIRRVEMSDNDTFWCRADVLETGESRDFPITVIISSRQFIYKFNENL